MKRRSYIAAICSAGAVATAGCGAIAANQTLSDPTVHTESSGEKGLIFTSNGEEIGDFGVDGAVVSGRIDLSTEIPHREGTTVKSITLRLWMPEVARERPAKVAVVSPVQGDSSPPPSLSLYTPDRGLGTVVEITDLDDLADETIGTLDLVVLPQSETATELAIDVTIELSGGILGSDYTLNGELQLAYPELADR
ncbi:hypothetical protein [Halosimplex sp. J119]